MRISVKAVAVFLAVVLGVSTMPAQAATLPPNFDTSVLTDLHSELNGFGTDPAKQISNALLDKAGVEQDGNAYTKKVNLFGKETTIFFMYGHKKNAPNVAVSVVAVMVPMDLTSKALFGDSVPGIGLKNPVVCYAKEDCDLLTADMPARTQPSLKSIMPSNIVAAKGLNFFGTLTSSIEGFPYALPSEMFAGFATGKNEKGQKKYTINAAIIKPWNNPLGLQNTTMKGGMFRLQKEGEVKTTEVLGTASVGSPKEYTLYYKQEGVLQQSLGFDARDASLKDFFSILDALGMPFESAKKNLPLTIVQLSNPNFQPKTDASAPPDFTKMLFKATRTATGVFTELIANAEGAILKQKMASLILNASAAKKSVEGSAGVNAKLGPLNAGSANFYLTANLTAVPKMGLKVKSGLLGDLDLAASGNGLKLDVPADCPLRPIGFTANITDLSLTDFPITPDLKDCYSKEITKVFNGTVEVASDVGEEVAKEAVATANFLGDEAKKGYESLQVERVGVMGKALVNHARAKDAVKVAEYSYSNAKYAVTSLVDDIVHLDKTIKSLAKDLSSLMKSAWNFVTGKVKAKKKEKATAQATRDKKRAAHALAVHKEAQAKAALEKAKSAPTEIPGPNLDEEVVKTDREMVGALTQQQVQPLVAEYAANELPNKLKNKDERQRMMQALDIEEFKARQAEAITTAYPTLSALYTKQQDGKRPMEQLLDNAKRELVEKAIARDIDAKTNELLQDVVATLPTMAFDVPVKVVYGEGTSARCLEAPARSSNAISVRNSKLAVCNDSPRQIFRFTAGGGLLAEGSQPIFFIKGRGEYYLYKYDKTADSLLRAAVLSIDFFDTKVAKNVFFDPIGGIFSTYFPKNDGGSEVVFLTASQDGELEFVNDPHPQDAAQWWNRRSGRHLNNPAQWHLEPADKAMKSAQAASVQKVLGKTKPGALKKSLMESGPTTNLAPLQLDNSVGGNLREN
jgi:hypothetical protein